MFERPIWNVFKFGDLCNRRLPLRPTAFLSTGSAPFEGIPSSATAPLTLDQTAVKSAVASAAKETQQIKKGAKRKKTDEGQEEELKHNLKEWINITISKSVESIMGQLVAHYDGRSGNILMEIQNIRDELTAVKKEISHWKGTNQGQTASLVDTLKGCAAMAQGLSEASSQLLSDQNGELGKIHQRLDALESNLKLVEMLKDDGAVMTKLDTMLEKLGQLTLPQQILPQHHMGPQIIQQVPMIPQQQHQNAFYQQYPPANQQYMPPPQSFQPQFTQGPQLPQQTAQHSLEDIEGLLNYSFLGSPHRQTSGRGDQQGGPIMQQLKNYQQSQPSNTIVIGNEEDSRCSTLSNADQAVVAANHVLESAGEGRPLGGTTYRRMVSFDKASNVKSVEVTTFEETRFRSGTNTATAEKLENGLITDYGVMHKLKNGSGSRLVGIAVEEIPQALRLKLVTLLKHIGVQQSRDGSTITSVITSCLKAFFKEMKMLADQLPLVFMGKPVYAYDATSPLGALNSLIENNVEPLKSILKFIRRRLIVVEEGLLTRCMRQSLKDLQKAYRAHKSCKHTQKLDETTVSIASSTESLNSASFSNPNGKSTKMKSGRKQVETPAPSTSSNTVEANVTQNQPPPSAPKGLIQAMGTMSETERRRWLEMMGGGSDEDSSDSK